MLAQFNARNRIDEVRYDTDGEYCRIRGYHKERRWWGTKSVLVYDARGYNLPTAISAIVNPNPNNILESYEEYVPLIHRPA